MQSTQGLPWWGIAIVGVVAALMMHLANWTRENGPSAALKWFDSARTLLMTFFDRPYPRTKIALVAQFLLAIWFFWPTIAYLLEMREAGGQAFGYVFSRFGKVPMLFLLGSAGIAVGGFAYLGRQAQQESKPTEASTKWWENLPKP